MGGHRRRVKSGPSWHCGSLGESPGASLHPRPLTAPWAVSPVLCQAQRARLVSLGASEVGVIRPILRMGVNEAPRPARPDPMQGPPSHFPSGLTSAAPGRAFPRAEAGSAGPECLFRPGRAPGRRGGNGRKMFVQLGGGRSGSTARSWEGSARGEVSWSQQAWGLACLSWGGRAAHSRHLLDKEARAPPPPLLSCTPPAPSFGKQWN